MTSFHWTAKAAVAARSRLVCAGLLFAIGCAGDGGSGKGIAEPEQLPLLVDVAGGTLHDGMAAGRLRREVALPDFQITKHPITNAEYGECVSAGACKQVEKLGCEIGEYGPLAGFDIDEPESPALCINPRHAAGYCKWIGGRLPRLTEWLYAARGPEPRRYAWGDKFGNCEQHARMMQIAKPEEGSEGQPVGFERCAGKDAKLLIGQHAKGAAPSGMQDVLLTPGELLATHKDALFSACGDGIDACVVTGREAGAIEGVSAIEDGSEPVIHGFRCVVEED